MNRRALTSWAVLLGLLAVVLAAVEQTEAAVLGAGLFCIAVAAGLVYLDRLRP